MKIHIGKVEKDFTEECITSHPGLAAIWDFFVCIGLPSMINFEVNLFGYLAPLFNQLYYSAFLQYNINVIEKLKKLKIPIFLPHIFEPLIIFRDGADVFPSEATIQRMKMNFLYFPGEYFVIR